MILPQNTTAIYTLTVPSTQKEFKFRQFFVKDEKALLIAQESENATVMLDTIKEVIKRCNVNNIDVEKLASFDIEYIFLQMRSKSVGEMVSLTFSCDVDHGKDNEKAKVVATINLEDVVVEKIEGHTNKIGLFGDVGVVMKYPSIDTIKKVQTNINEDVDTLFSVITDCVEYIYDTDQIYYSKEIEKAELIEFMNNLTSEQFNKIQNFFRTMPKIRVYVKFKCPVCGLEHNKYLEGLSSFF
jgi:hypothetical protein